MLSNASNDFYVCSLIAKIVVPQSNRNFISDKSEWNMGFASIGEFQNRNERRNTKKKRKMKNHQTTPTLFQGEYCLFQYLWSFIQFSVYHNTTCYVYVMQFHLFGIHFLHCELRVSLKCENNIQLQIFVLNQFISSCWNRLTTITRKQ